MFTSILNWNCNVAVSPSVCSDNVVADHKIKSAWKEDELRSPSEVIDFAVNAVSAYSHVPIDLQSETTAPVRRPKWFRKNEYKNRVEGERGALLT